MCTQQVYLKVQQNYELLIPLRTAGTSGLVAPADAAGRGQDAAQGRERTGPRPLRQHVLPLQIDTQSLDVRSESLKVRTDLVPAPRCSGNLAARVLRACLEGHLVTAHLVLSPLARNCCKQRSSRHARDRPSDGPTPAPAACLLPTKQSAGKTPGRDVGRKRDAGACHLMATVRVLCST